MQFIKKNFYSLIKLGISYLRGKSYPFVCVLRLNDSCNMSCHYCDSYKLTKSIDITTLITFLDKIYKKGCRFLILTGGEAFLYEERDALMEWLKNKNIYLVINTNGKLAGNDKYYQFLRFADEVLLSIDGPEKYNDLHRGAGTHKKVIQTLDYVYSLKKKITFSVVLTKHNAKPEVYDYINKLKTHYKATVGINPVTPHGRINNTAYSNETAVSVEQLIEFKNYILLHKKNFKEIPHHLLEYLLKPKPFTCKTMKYALYVDVDHGIYPCINVTDRSDARFSSLETYNGAYSKEIKCKTCNCTPLIMSNLMFQEKRFPSLKDALSIIKRHL